MHNLFERTLIIIKPDGIQRGLIGEIITRFEKRGLQLFAAKFIHVGEEFAKKHYAIHKGNPFYEGLIKYITSTPVLAMVWAGENAIDAVRQTVGKTNPLESEAGTIRHDLAILTSRNLIHASDSKETAEKEIDLWFKPIEISEWNSENHKWVFGKN